MVPSTPDAKFLGAFASSGDSQVSMLAEDVAGNRRWKDRASGTISAKRSNEENVSRDCRWESEEGEARSCNECCIASAAE